MTKDFDVIVVGTGAAGLSAALLAGRAGASVLMVEADTQVGGSSRLSGGHVYAAGTSIQRAAGITEDSADAMFEHYMTLNQWLVEPAIVRRFCDLSAPTLEWLIEQGVEFSPDTLYPSGVGSTPRGHPPNGGGAQVVAILDALCAQAGVERVLNARVTDLVQTDTGVGGVRIGTDQATAHAVVLTTGGFGANPQLLAQYYPAAHANGNWTWYIGSDHAQGDGLALGESVGGVIEGMNRGLLLLTPGFSRDLEVGLPSWLVLVNQAGRRFCNEQAPYAVMAGLFAKQAGPCFAVFDHRALLQAKPSAQSQAYWVTDTLQQKISEGTVVAADTVAALAQQLDISAAGLTGTLTNYNQDCAQGSDSRYFKPGPLTPIEQGPFYAAEVRPAIVCWTGAGLRINADTQVLDAAEQPIPGLYAAGETVGSLHGDRYIGGGGSFGPCIVFGRLAGVTAAQYARSQQS